MTKPIYDVYTLPSGNLSDGIRQAVAAFQKKFCRLPAEICLHPSLPEVEGLGLPIVRNRHMAIWYVYLLVAEGESQPEQLALF